MARGGGPPLARGKRVGKGPRAPPVVGLGPLTAVNYEPVLVRGGTLFGLLSLGET